MQRKWLMDSYTDCSIALTADGLERTMSQHYPYFLCAFKNYNLQNYNLSIYCNLWQALCVVKMQWCHCLKIHVPCSTDLPTCEAVANFCSTCTDFENKFSITKSCSADTSIDQWHWRPFMKNPGAQSINQVSKLKTCIYLDIKVCLQRQREPLIHELYLSLNIYDFIIVNKIHGQDFNNKWKI